MASQDTRNMNPHYDSSRMHIHHHRQFFFDNLIIESAQYLRRRVDRPATPEAPLIEKDRPWEHVTYFTTGNWNVIQDPSDHLFKCWYENWAMRHDQWCDQHDWHDGSLNYPSRVLYAQSRDGQNWIKPELDIFIEDGRKTNIVLGRKEFGSVHAASVFLDPFETDHQHRFKTFFSQGGRWVTPHMFVGANILASSGDGIHWTKVGSAPELDDVMTWAFDLKSKTYLLNTRHPRMYTVPLDPKNPIAPGTPPYWPENPFLRNKRRIFRMESHDLKHWTEIQPLLTPDDQIDNIDDAFYGMLQYHTGGMWIGFLNIFHLTTNRMDVQLIFSRDGRQFMRFQPGRAWLCPGEPGSWNQHMVGISAAPIEVGDDLYVYYNGSKNHHDWWVKGMNEAVDHPEARANGMDLVGYGLGLVKIKRDRFVSLNATPAREGILVTRPFYCEGGKLLANAACGPDGYIKVQALDGNTNDIIPGFEKDHCQTFHRDSVAHQFQWTSQQNLPNGWIKLHFFLKNADLYTFEIPNEHDQ